MQSGRPLRFLLMVTGGWAAIRIAMLWPGELPQIAAEALAGPAAAARPLSASQPISRPQDRHQSVSGRFVPTATHSHSYATQPPVPWAQPGAVSAIPAPALPSQAMTQPQSAPPIEPGIPARAPRHTSRWSGSFWLVARSGAGAGSGFTGPQLGGSQAGLRIAYALGQRLAIAARLASPLGAGQRDAAIGLEWRPTRLPVRLIAEQRFTLGPGRAGPTIGAIGGFGPTPIGHGLRAEGYGQAGYIARGSGGEGFADGAVRVAHPLGSLTQIQFDLGLSAWGAAQKGASRADVGPSLGAVARVGHQPVRLAIEWRQRVAGNATPASGPAVSLGLDF